MYILFNNYFTNIYLLKVEKWGLGIGDWGLGIGDWGLGPIPNPQSPYLIKMLYIKLKK